MARTCSTCHWAADTDQYGGEYAVCNAPGNMRSHRDRRTGFASGAPTRRFEFCSTHRSGWPIIVDLFSLLIGACGPIGRWWKAAKSSEEQSVSPSEASAGNSGLDEQSSLIEHKRRAF